MEIKVFRDLALTFFLAKGLYEDLNLLLTYLFSSVAPDIKGL